jgi:precorrin-6B methylase 2
MQYKAVQYKAVQYKAKKTITRELTHGQMLTKHLLERRPFLRPRCVLVETGCGISTLSLAEAGMSLAAFVYSCDLNDRKVAELKKRAGMRVSNVEFIIGDSKETLPQIAAKHGQIDFIFLDAAASAMHTFQEFLAVESFMKPGASLLIDNAALPTERAVLSPCRKGKVIVPYLLASRWWEVRGHPTAGDSMVSAIRHEKPERLNRDYEWPEFVDPWEAEFAQAFGPSG